MIPEQGNFVLREELAYAEGKTVDELLSPHITPTTLHVEKKKKKVVAVGLGKTSFQQHCSMCHALDKRLIGPPLQEIVKTFKGNPQGIFNQVRNPQKKLPDYPPMPPIASETLSDDDLMAIANYILHIAGEPSDATPPKTSPELPKEEKKD